VPVPAKALGVQQLAFRKPQKKDRRARGRRRSYCQMQQVALQSTQVGNYLPTTTTPSVVIIAVVARIL
jgi:hypothetical protein